MLNLSEEARKSPTHPFWRKINHFRDPDIYLAEDVKDFVDNGKNLPYPWYKKPVPHIIFSYLKRAYIIFQNVGIRTVEAELGIKDSGSNHFLVHDDSGVVVMYWGFEGQLDVGSRQSYEKAQDEQGLKKDDWVYDIFVRYIIKANLPTIVEVRKYRFSNPKPEKAKLLQRVREFLPTKLSIPQPI